MLSAHGFRMSDLKAVVWDVTLLAFPGEEVFSLLDSVLLKLKPFVIPP